MAYPSNQFHTVNAIPGPLPYATEADYNKGLGVNTSYTFAEDVPAPRPVKQTTEELLKTLQELSFNLDLLEDSLFGSGGQIGCPKDSAPRPVNISYDLDESLRFAQRAAQRIQVFVSKIGGR